MDGTLNDLLQLTGVIIILIICAIWLWRRITRKITPSDNPSCGCSKSSRHSYPSPNCASCALKDSCHSSSKN